MHVLQAPGCTFFVWKQSPLHSVFPALFQGCVCSCPVWREGRRGDLVAKGKRTALGSCTGIIPVLLTRSHSDGLRDGFGAGKHPPAQGSAGTAWTVTSNPSTSEQTCRTLPFPAELPTRSSESQGSTARTISTVGSLHKCPQPPRDAFILEIYLPEGWAQTRALPLTGDLNTPRLRGAVNTCSSELHAWLWYYFCFWQVGDSGYPLSLYLMKPSINPSTLAKGNYNKARSAMGSAMRGTFGILIMKFQSRHCSRCSEEVQSLCRIFFFLA